MTRTEQILQFIVRFKRAKDGNSPTIREIGRACDISSTSIVRYHLEKLEHQGLIQMARNGKTRGIQVVGGRWTLDQETTKQIIEAGPVVIIDRPAEPVVNVLETV